MIPRPIYNMGNTCYLNSCLQILFAIPEIHTIMNLPVTQQLLNKIPQQNTDDILMVKEWCNMCRDISTSQDSKHPIAPYVFLKSIFNLAQTKHMDSFVYGAQNDSSEFLLLFINSLHDALKRPVQMNIRGQSKSSKDSIAVQCYSFLKTIYEKEYSEIYETFYGLQYTEIIDPESKQCLQIRPEHYFSVDIEIPKNTGQKITLKECIEQNTSDEILDNENAWYNENTKQKQSVIKRIRYWNYPKILVICLKRFSYLNGYPEKINTHIDFPLLEYLDMGPYLSGYSSFHANYKLFGICNHIGVANGGHYNSFVYTGEQWFFCDDTIIQIVPTEQYQKMVTEHAYILFYAHS